jgi:hypothetical protein
MFQSVGEPDAFKLVGSPVPVLWPPWPWLGGESGSCCSAPVWPAAERVQVWPMAPGPLIWFVGSLHDSESDCLSNARAVGPRVAHGPSVPEWRTGGTRAVSSPSGARAVSTRVAHGPSVPERRTGRQCPTP